MTRLSALRTGRLYPPGDTPDTSFLLESFKAGRIKSMKNHGSHRESNPRPCGFQRSAPTNCATACLLRLRGHLVTLHGRWAESLLQRAKDSRQNTCFLEESCSRQKRPLPPPTCVTTIAAPNRNYLLYVNHNLLLIFVLFGSVI